MIDRFNWFHLRFLTFINQLESHGDHPLQCMIPDRFYYYFIAASIHCTTSHMRTRCSNAAQEAVQSVHLVRRQCSLQSSSPRTRGQLDAPGKPCRNAHTNAADSSYADDQSPVKGTRTRQRLPNLLACEEEHPQAPADLNVVRPHRRQPVRHLLYSSFTVQASASLTRSEGCLLPAAGA
jgi:hypothetical protein